MAAADGGLESLGDEFLCWLCLGYFEEPVTAHCGHSFCRGCITRRWARCRDTFPCPQCGAESPEIRLRPNRQLRNAADLLAERRGFWLWGSRAGDRRWEPQCRKEFPEIELRRNRRRRILFQLLTKRRDFLPRRSWEGDRLCEKHGERLNLFCEEDRTPICVICRVSQAHRSHSVEPLEEESQGFKKQLETERQKIVAEFQQLHRFLEKQERLLLAQLEELNKEIEKAGTEYVAKLSEELSSFSSLISEMEQKCQQPASEFLQDIKGALSRCEREKFQNPVAFSSDLKWRIRESSQRNASLETIMKKFKDSLSSRLRLDKANVTLDPHTAHPNLILSADRRSVREGDTRQDLRNNPERFEPWGCVLGCEGFTSGRHYWEVGVEVEGGVCVVGVARASVSRKGEISFTPEQGIWALKCSEDQCWDDTSPEELLTSPPSRAPRRIRVYLDYEGGQVAFFDPGTGDLIGTFPPASFGGDRIRPFFQVANSCPFFVFRRRPPLSPTPLISMTLEDSATHLPPQG